MRREALPSAPWLSQPRERRSGLVESCQIYSQQAPRKGTEPSANTKSSLLRLVETRGVTALLHAAGSSGCSEGDGVTRHADAVELEMQVWPSSGPPPASEHLTKNKKKKKVHL